MGRTVSAGENQLERRFQIPCRRSLCERRSSFLFLPHKHCRTGTRHAFRNGAGNKWPALFSAFPFLSCIAFISALSAGDLFVHWACPLRLARVVHQGGVATTSDNPAELAGLFEEYSFEISI